MIISLIAAISQNGVIGKNNALPWKLPADMKRFRDLTRGKSVIMGRRTFESIGRPLPDRLNIVMTHNRSYQAEGCTVVHSISEALDVAKNYPEVMVIGGAYVYSELLPLAGRMYLTLIHEHIDGDAHFPHYESNGWQETEHVDYSPDDKNPHRYTFMTLERK